jgi:hypothetical protein
LHGGDCLPASELKVEITNDTVEVMALFHGSGGAPKEEPLNQLVPLVEFSFDSPRGQYTAATMNPGFAYVAVTWQADRCEAIVPLNQAGGTGLGFRAQVLFLSRRFAAVCVRQAVTE